jgi:hypothetical protein
MPMNVEQFERQPQRLVRVGRVLLTKGLQSRRATGVHLGRQSTKNERHQAMMMRELRPPFPIHTVPENLLDTRGRAPVRIVAATGQNQVEFGAENAGVSSNRAGQPGWRRLRQGDGRR